MATHVGSKNLLSVKLENQTQYTVGGRVLGTKVDSEMTKRTVLPGTTFTQDLLCALVVELLDSVGRGGGRDGDGLGLGASILSLSGKRAACGSGEKARRGRRCAERYSWVAGRTARKREGAIVNADPVVDMQEWRMMRCRMWVC